MNMKYKLRKDLNLDLGLKTLYRIEALQNFSDVKKGEAILILEAMKMEHSIRYVIVCSNGKADRARWIDLPRA